MRHETWGTQTGHAEPKRKARHQQHRPSEIFVCLRSSANVSCSIMLRYTNQQVQKCMDWALHASSAENLLGHSQRPAWCALTQYARGEPLPPPVAQDPRQAQCSRTWRRVQSWENESAYGQRKQRILLLVQFGQLAHHKHYRKFSDRNSLQMS